MPKTRWIWLIPVFALTTAACTGNCDPNTTQGLSAGACLVMGDDGGFSGRKKEKQQELADLRLENAELKGDIADAETDLYNVQQKRKAAERRQAEQQKRLDQLKQQEAASTQRNAALEDQIAELEQELSQSKTQTSDLGSEEKELEQKIAKLKTQEQALQSDIEAVSSTR